jgi:hypothetical protein
MTIGYFVLHSAHTKVLKPLKKVLKIYTAIYADSNVPATVKELT